MLADSAANFKADVALYSHVDPMATISRSLPRWASPRALLSITCWPKGVGRERSSSAPKCFCSFVCKIDL
jgi:hypothetical protein